MADSSGLDTHSVPLAALLEMLDASGEGVLIVTLDDPRLPLIHVNRAFETISGYSRREALGQNTRFLQAADQLQSEIEILDAAIARGAPASVTLRNYRKDGTVFWNALRLLPLIDGNGQPTHYLGLMRDVTETNSGAPFDRTGNTAAFIRRVMTLRTGRGRALATGAWGWSDRGSRRVWNELCSPPVGSWRPST